MLEACLQPELVCEITVQPVRRHQVDAGIFFSDIVVPARLAGLDVEIVPGKGPVFANPVRTADQVASLPPLGDRFEEALHPIREAVRLTTAELDSRHAGTPLIGFCGAPFTVASYLVEGGPSRDHLRTRALMREDPATWDALASWVAELSGRFLRAQVLAGARAVQLFDSWVGSLGEDVYRRHVLPHSAEVFSHVADLDVPRIHFGVGTGHLLRPLHEAGGTVIGVDHRIRLDQANRILGGTVPLQGNIDPAVLFTGSEARYREAREVLAAGAAAPGHVVNLGHGVPPDTDPGVLTDLVAYLHDQPVPPAGTGASADAAGSTSQSADQIAPVIA
jgi:uroporphyrinogen decarboxylase